MKIKFCNHCGERLAFAQEYIVRHCSRCGNKLDRKKLESVIVPSTKRKKQKS